MSKCWKYWLFTLVIVLILSAYPLYMGGKVWMDVLQDGIVHQEDYPKYVIPYTPISLAVLAGVLLLPAAIRRMKKWALPLVSLAAVALFLGFEYGLEEVLVLTETGVAELESWQMFMCYIPPQQVTYKTLTAVQVLMGEYSPGFKLHFYIISIVLILSALNCFHGFGVVLRSGDRRQMKSLWVQTAATALFLGLCVFACFTAFYRTGELRVGALSAVLMWLFFAVFGVTAGLYTGSFLLGKGKRVCVYVPFAVACAMTAIMYVGEMILLHGNVYRFGEGFLFDGLGALVLAPVDLLVIAAAGAVTGLIMKRLKK